MAAKVSQPGWLACSLVRCPDIAHGGTAGKPRDIIVIAMTQTSRPSADTTPLRCVAAKPLISRADDAGTQITQESRPTLRGRSRKEEATMRRSGHRMAATARRRLRPHQPRQTVSCGRANPLIPTDATASDRTDRKKRPSFYFFGTAVAARRPPWRGPASARCAGFAGQCFGFPARIPEIPCSGASNSLIIFPDRAAQVPSSRARQGVFRLLNQSLTSGRRRECERFARLSMWETPCICRRR